MSVQLILYPQNHSGIFNPISTSIATTEYVVNGISFTGMNSTSLYNSSSSLAPFPYFASGGSASFQNQGMALSPGVWRRFTSLSSPTWGDVVAPQKTGSSLLLSYNATAGYTGVSQRLSNLVIGAEYTVTINISATVVGSLAVIIYDGIVPVNSFGGGIAYQSLVGPFNYTFTATSSYNQSIQLVYTSATGSILIKDVSITKTIPGVTSLIDGQVICDLYEDEDIPLSLSIDDFKNVAEQVKSYSKDFNLPATKRNNRIFDQMYEVTRADDKKVFNPYVKTQCVLKQDGFILFEGYLRLIDVKDKEGEISYNVNLYSEVVALADVLKDRTFSELDFTELAHDYNYTEIRNSWQGQLTVAPLPITSFANNTGVAGATTTNVLKYPFIDWNHQISPNTTTSFPVLSNLETAFRPCIRLKYLIQNIFAATQFNWESNFFDSADFDKLYMDFNWGAASTIIEGNGEFGTTGTNLSTTAFTNLELDVTNFPDEFGWDSTNFRFVAPQDGIGYIISSHFEFVMASASTLSVQWVHKNSGGTVLNTFNYASASQGLGNVVQWDANLFASLSLNDTLQAQFKTTGAGDASQRTTVSAPWSSVVASTGMIVGTSNTLLQTLRGELGQWDFLKGIMTMFNLVSLVDESDPNTIRIEPYSDVFINNTKGAAGDFTLASRGIQHDWTEKIDDAEMELKPLNDLNKKTIFKFVEDDDDYAFSVYKNSTGHLYGSKVFPPPGSSPSSFNILEGEEEITAEPFAATVSKPLMEEFPDFVVPALYAQGSDDSWEGFDNSPRIFYENGVKTLTSCTYDVPIQNGVPGDDFEDEFLQFSHLSIIPSVSATTKDFVFESQQLISAAVGFPPIDNLYSTYWQPYFNELYNADTRIMTLRVNLSPSDVSNFKMYDTVFIKNRIFRVNKIEYKPNALAKVEFILIP
jgi:hypothetical protein